MADENDILESWEELDDKEVLDKRLQDIKITQPEKNGTDDGVSQMKEEGSRTQYTPQVRILKRSTDDNAESAKNNKSKVQVQPQKTLQQREAEYKEARLRILGEDYSGAAENCNNSATVPESRPMKLIKQTEEMKLQPNKVQLLREPRGPDGSAGFDQNR
ncbi:SUZ domain-containing protein 1-like [Ruditapes philippinarum]|uniref:SUZ domain-containing protein 1-like n=1 Tax=Ruditapes philippinarum TaxID=129788 RepID=UPI00295B7C16|nr:SUZ domain-containing protein 1-like [Ruditapes philippinarum]